MRPEVIHRQAFQPPVNPLKVPRKLHHRPDRTALLGHIFFNPICTPQMSIGPLPSLWAFFMESQPSFVTKCNYGIDFCGAACRDVAGNQGYRA
jgi:hypothetical protein